MARILMYGKSNEQGAGSSAPVKKAKAFSKQSNQIATRKDTHYEHTHIIRSQMEPVQRNG